METLLINEQFVAQFKYWQQDQVRTGMRFRNNLFEYVAQFDRQQRHQAFDLAWQLSQAGRQLVVTSSSEFYTVWADLRYSDCAHSNRSQVSSAKSAYSLAANLREVALTA